MILIADSGSTKTDWAIIEDGTSKKETIVQTSGFNPLFHSTSFIVQEISSCSDLISLKEEIKHVYFYGAGCSSEDKNRVIGSALNQVFKGAKVIVNHDIAAVVNATTNTVPAICCILGTGSNCIFYTGETTNNFTSSLGYILGDEGSGAHIGKYIAADFINHNLPNELYNYLEGNGLSKSIIFEKVYQNTNANRYLASLVKLITDFKATDYIQRLLINSFSEFIDKHICKVPSYNSYEVHFCGSIAFHFKEELRQALNLKKINLGKVIKSPIHNLIQYHKT